MQQSFNIQAKLSTAVTSLSASSKGK